MSDYQDLQRQISEGYERVAEFVVEALEQGRDIRADWPAVLHDVAMDIDKIVQRDAHPDDTDSARLAMHSLAKLWLDEDQVDALHMYGLAVPPGGSSEVSDGR